MDKQLKGSLQIVLAALLWGTLGVFGRLLGEQGVLPLAIVTIRILIAFFGLVLYWIFAKKKMPYIRKEDWLLLIVYTILSVVAYNFFYFTAISLIPIAVASILLYLSPAFVLILSVLVLKEQISFRKVISLFIVLIGIFLVVNIQNLEGLNFWGLLCGIFAGLTFSLYSLLGKKLSENNESFSIVTVSFGIGFFGLLIMSIMGNQLSFNYSTNAYLLLIILGLLPTLSAFILYNLGLKNIEASKASIISTIEPITAAVLGYLFLQESLSFNQILGIVIVVLGIAISSFSNSKKL